MRDESRHLFALESPPFHRFRLHEPNRFRGIVLPVDAGERPATISVSVDGRHTGSFPCTLPSPDIGLSLPHRPAAGACRFDFVLPVAEDARRIDFELDRPSGPAHLGSYDLSFLHREREWLAKMASGVDALPAPGEELVFATQGHRDVAAYRDSIVAGQFHLRFGLGDAAVAGPGVRAALDFGCGTGRLLAGWWLDSPSTALFGCDIADELASWAQVHLPAAIRVERSSLEPPLPFEDHRFDVILAVSVFTHLSLALQRRWADEFRRLLAPSGKLLVTTHGRPYVRLFANDRLAEFDRDGYLEISSAEEGRNSFATFHARAFAESLFPGFQPAGYFASGATASGAAMFPLASFQDVHVLRQSDLGDEAGR